MLPTILEGRTGATLAVLMLSLAGRATAHEPPGMLPELLARIQALDAMYETFALCHCDPTSREIAFVYGDTNGIIHHIVTADGRLWENWRSFPLETPIREIFARDLDSDGSIEIVAYTLGGRIYVWRTEDYQLVWDSRASGVEIGFIQAMVIADVDADEALELVMCVGNRIVYYDGVEFFREKEGREFLLNPSQMVVGDVDGDGELEIITNDGHVISSRTLLVEWATKEFGYPLTLFDLDNDDVLDLVGKTRGAITFWNIQEHREMW